MLHQVAAIAIAMRCASTTKPLENWGIMTSAGEAPAIYSPGEWRPGTKLRAYPIGRLKDAIEVSVASASRSADSPLYGPDGGNSAWKHAVAEPKKVPPGTLWICVPIDWVVTPGGPNQATVRSPTERAGTISSSLTAEGVQMVVEMGPRKEKLYWYLGYDVAPSPAGR